jgi:hypothetical protein
VNRPRFDEDAWLGGFYELSMELGARSDERLLAAAEALWSHPALEGPYAERNVARDRQERVGVERLLVDGEHVYGVATLPGDVKTPAGSLAFRDDPGATDNLSLYLPLGGLSEAGLDTDSYPWDEETSAHAWIGPLEEWLVEVAKWVFARVPFEFAAVGFEVNPDPAAVERWRTEGLPPPDEQPYGILWPAGQRLDWHPLPRAGTA